MIHLHQGQVVRRRRQILVVVLGYHCVSPWRSILYLGYFSKKKITHTCGQGQTSPGLRPPSAKDAWSCSLAFHWTESLLLTGQHIWQTNPSISWLSEYILSGEAERCFTISRLVQSTCNFNLTVFYALLKDSGWWKFAGFRRRQKILKFSRWARVSSFVTKNVVFAHITKIATKM